MLFAAANLLAEVVVSSGGSTGRRLCIQFTPVVTGKIPSFTTWFCSQECFTTHNHWFFIDKKPKNKEECTKIEAATFYNLVFGSDLLYCFLCSTH